MSICDTHWPWREHLQRANVAFLLTNVSFHYSYLRMNRHKYESTEKFRATVAGDKQVRVFDIAGNSPGSQVGQETNHSTTESLFRVIRCHSGRVKRIVVEQSPDLFLTVAEVCYLLHYYPRRFTLNPLDIQDGSVRQHDLRTSHTCNFGTCPTPLVKLPHDLSTIALSPLTPYQFVVGGESPYACISTAAVKGTATEEFRRAICSIGGKRDVFFKKNGESRQALMILRLVCGVLDDDPERLVNDRDASISQALEWLPLMDMR